MPSESSVAGAHEVPFANILLFRFDTLLRNLPDSTRALISIDLFAALVASLPYIAPFVGTDLSMIVELSSAVRIRVWSPNQLLWEEGGCDGVYFLQKGVVGLDGVAYLRGDTIGVECLRENNPHRDARCLTFVTAHFLPRDVLKSAVQKRPWVEDVAKQWTAWKVFQIYIKTYTKLYFRMCKRGARAKPRPRLSRRGVFMQQPTPGSTPNASRGVLAPGASVFSSASSNINLTPMKEDEWDDIDEMVLEWIHSNGF